MKGSERNRISIRLHDTERDRVIKGWLESVKRDPSVNVSEIVKNHLYSVATGTVKDSTQLIIKTIRDEFAKLPSMIRVQGGTVDIEETPADDAEEITRRLGSMPD